MEKLFIIGMGPGNEDLLTARAKSVLKTSSRVLNTRETSLAKLILELKNTAGGTVAVIVSGDCGFFSVAKTIIKDFSASYEIELIPGISSIQYLSAKLKVAYDDAALISLHGRAGRIVPKVAYNKKVFALTGGPNSVQDICRTLNNYGLGSVNVSIGERLSFTDEKISCGSAATCMKMEFAGLSVMYIENPAAVSPHLPLTDNEFIRGSTPMTKEEIRWLSIQKLGIKPADIVFDIGAGTGSVAVEMARKAYDGFVYAIEMQADACALVQKNLAKHGAFNIQVVEGEAPAALTGLPVPDKAFIGGSSGNLEQIIAQLLILNPIIKIVVNAVSLQTLSQIMQVFVKRRLINLDTICVNIAKAQKAGNYDLMMAQNPVYIVTGIGNG